MRYGDAALATLLITALIAIVEPAAFILPNKRIPNASLCKTNVHRRHGVHRHHPRNQHPEGINIDTNDNPNQHRGWISSYSDDQSSEGDSLREPLTRGLDGASWSSYTSSVDDEDAGTTRILFDDGGEEAWLEAVASIMAPDATEARSAGVNRPEKVREVQEISMGP